MLAQTPAQTKFIVRPVVVVYEVKQNKRTFSVSVTLTGAIACNCGKFKHFGECEHIEAVELERMAKRAAK